MVLTRPTLLSAVAALFIVSPAIRAQNLKDLDAAILSKEQSGEAKGMIARDIKRRTDAFNVQHRQTWSKVTTREEWEKYRGERIAKLRQALGGIPAPRDRTDKIMMRRHFSRTVKGDGFVIQNVAYPGESGYWVTANLYQPANKPASMPGILIAHAHHNGKTQGELQDMGMTWARAGCQVLVIDQVGYGERRNHPFHRDADYAKPYKTGRQDYYFRYDSGVQLQLLGDSLMGWMAGDLSRGVDFLLAEGADAKKIILLGSVAGGGDPAGVAAALDRRIKCCVPFNFGGPQPETRYPLPDDAETSFNYLMGTYWDSTRGLRLGASGDFPHWLIVASTAPRYLIHGHEFAWDGERDPAWKRYQKVWGEFYGAKDHLGVAHGKGRLKERPPAASHCNHIGAFHRMMIHPLFEKWFGIKAEEYSSPRPREELICLTDEFRADMNIGSMSEIMSAQAKGKVQEFRQELKDKSPEERRRLLRDSWSKLLGPTVPGQPAAVKSRVVQPLGDAKSERIVLEVEPGILVPMLFLVPSKPAVKVPAVVCLSADGKAGFLKNRADELQKLLRAGVMVVLPDVRGTGETRTGSAAGRDSTDTDHSVHVQLFGETLLGQRLRDMRGVLGYLRGRGDVDAKRISLWGDSFAPVNGPDTDFKVPHAVDGRPKHATPLGGLLALFGALFDGDVRSIYVAGGLTSYQSILGHFSVLVPHGDCVPGALRAGDLSDVASSLAPLPVRLESMVDHLNRIVPEATLRKVYASATSTTLGQKSSAADWLLESLQR